MKLHREGYLIILIAFLILDTIELGNYYLLQITGWNWLFLLLSAGALIMMYLVV